MKEAIYHDLVKKKQQILKSIEDLQKRTRHINQCMEELEAAKRIIIEKADSYQKMTNEFFTFPHEYEYSWRGDVYDHATYLFWEDAQTETKKILEQMRERADAINEEINRLENQCTNNERSLLLISTLKEAVFVKLNEFKTTWCCVCQSH